MTQPQDNAFAFDDLRQVADEARGKEQTRKA